jgi:hypothetical protein
MGIIKIEKRKSKTGELASLIVAVCTVVIVVHWPALSAKALSFDDQKKPENRSDKSLCHIVPFD